MRFVINANFGSFGSLQEAANAEKLIDWWDDRDIRQNYCTECFAAEEIIIHLQKAGLYYLGDRSANKNYDEDRSEPDVVISVGKTVIEQLTSETLSAGRDGAYRSFYSNGLWNVWIWGETCFSTLRAAYAWMQSLGICWYTPDENGTYIPMELSFDFKKVKLNYDYLTRGCYNEFIDDNNPGFINWAGRNAMNMIRVQYFLNPHSVKKRGLQIMSGGHELFYKYLNPNTVIKSNNADNGKSRTYFEEHPDWYALINGKRSSRDENTQATEGYYTGDNICTSNLGGIKELTKNLINGLNDGDYKYCEYLNLWAYDNGKWCECANCRKLGNLSRRMLMLAYNINKILVNAYEQGTIRRMVKLVIPVYHETLLPPDLSLPEDFDYNHIIATFFPIERCYAHNIDDEECTETNSILKKLYEGWADSCKSNYKGEIFIGEYYNVSSFASMPLVFTSTMANDIPYYWETGTKHFYYMHISARKWGSLLLNNCILAGFLKDVNFDMKDFYRKLYLNYYPKTGAVMKKFHKVLEIASANMKYLKHYQFIDEEKKVSLIGEITKEEKFPTLHCKFDNSIDDYNNAISFTATLHEFEKAARYIGEAVDLVSGPEKKRIQIEKMRFDYGFKVIEFIYFYVKLRFAYEKKDKEMVFRTFRKTETMKKELLAISEPLEEMIYESPWYANAFTATWHDKTYNNLKQKIEKEYF